MRMERVAEVSGSGSGQKQAEGGIAGVIVAVWDLGGGRHTECHRAESLLVERSLSNHKGP